MSQDLSEQEIIRREKLQNLEAAGINPYPAPLYPVSHYSAEIKQNFSEETKDNYASVCVAGRIMSVNDKGKVLFVKIQDNDGIFQLYINSLLYYFFHVVILKLFKTHSILLINSK